jgi:3-oxoacyl-[acyl-carrier-protein] synthase-1
MKEIVIAGVGALTAVGMTAPSSAAAVRAGLSGFTASKIHVDHFGEPVIEARVPHIEANPATPGRSCALVEEALLEVLDGKDLPPVPLFLGLSEPRPGRPEHLEPALVGALKLYPSIAAVTLLPRGHAAGLLALETGVNHLAGDRGEFCLVGGVDSYLAPDTLRWLEDNGQLHSQNNAYGFIPGEAAGLCLLATRAAAARRRLRSFARVMSVASGRETNVIKSDAVCLGRGLTDVFRKAIGGLPSEADRIDDVVCDLNGEPYRADEYGFAGTRLARRFRDFSEFRAPAECWGDVGAAAGALHLGLVAAGAARGYSRGLHCLVWGSSEGGDRGAAVLRPEPAEEWIDGSHG